MFATCPTPTPFRGARPLPVPTSAALRIEAALGIFTGAKRDQRAVLLHCHRTTTEHARFMNEVACSSSWGPSIDVLVRVLQAQGQSIVSPSDRWGLHPFLVPVSSHRDKNNTLTCLLRWPEGHKGMELPIVSMQRGDLKMELLARSVNEYLHRALAEEEVLNSGGGAVAAAAGSEALAVYEPGAVARSGLPSLQAYLVRRAGMFPDVCESLALAHLAKGDPLSALITAEWYMRQGNFPEWGRPYEFAHGLLREQGRMEEGRDMARIALHMPWWTLSDGFEGMRDAAGMTGGADDVRAGLEELEEMSNNGYLKNFKSSPKSEKQKHMDAARHLMNRAAAGEVVWDAIRHGLAAEFKAAGLVDVSRFVDL